jgi:hypothetical protein
MPKDVHYRLRKDVEMPGGQVHHKGEEGHGSADDLRKVYGDAIEILRYADGDDYELSLKDQAAERREAAADDGDNAAAKGAK